MKTIKQLLVKYKTEILYLCFGVATTLINVLCYYVLNGLLSVPNVASTVIAWVVSVLFAFFTNRSVVFESKTRGAAERLKEFFAFLLSRVATGVLDVLVMWIAVDILKQNNLLWKIISNVIVVILNYVLGKLIFQRKKSDVK